MKRLAIVFLRQIQREFILYWRQPRGLINASLFFLMVLVFFPLTLPTDKPTLHLIAPGLVWLSMLLATLLSSERLFQQDYDDGIIEQWLLSSYPLSILVSVKILVHWLITLIAILLLCPIIAILFVLNNYETVILMLSLCCGTPAIFCLCALAAAFSTGFRQKGLLMALILLPLSLPILLMGSGTLMATTSHMAAVPAYCALLLAMSLLTIAFLPIAIAGVLRVTLLD